VPPDADLRRAAEVLNQGSRVVLLVGAGALSARAQLRAVAERLASPIVKSLPGKAVVPDDHPLTTGCAGVLGTWPSEAALAGADTLLVVGTNFPYGQSLPDPGEVRTVQLETDLARVGTSSDVDAPLVGDAAETLDALLPLLRRRRDRAFLAEAQAAMVRWRERLAALEDGSRDPVRPQYVLRVVDRLAAGDAVLAADAGTVATWAARHFDVRGGRDFLLSANLATAAAGLPYAMAAQWAHPDRQSVAVVGSDGFATLMAELRTAVEQRLPVKVVVCDTGSPAGGADPPADLARWADACGALGVRVQRAAEVEAAVGRAFAHPGPALVDVLVDPAERPRPAVAGGA
jgi:pyruvate dehydrogenase (quinone)